jgi:hypothetical protein
MQEHLSARLQNEGPRLKARSSRGHMLMLLPRERTGVSARGAPAASAAALRSNTKRDPLLPLPSRTRSSRKVVASCTLEGGPGARGGGGGEGLASGVGEKER